MNAVKSIMLRREMGIFVAIIVFCIIVGLIKPRFLALDNLRVIMLFVPLIMIAAMGEMLVIIARHVDLSVGSVYALSGMTAGYLATQGLPLWLCLGSALAIGAAVGAINGALVVRLRINSIILTIGTLLAVRGLADVVAAIMAGQRYAENFLAMLHLACCLILFRGL